MARSLPCIPMGCSACCRETTMPITKAEASRLARRTGMKQDDFSVLNDGILTLLNNADTKAFLRVKQIFDVQIQLERIAVAQVPT